MGLYHTFDVLMENPLALILEQPWLMEDSKEKIVTKTQHKKFITVELMYGYLYAK